MSDATPTPDADPSKPANKAQDEFDRYRARMSQPAPLPQAFAAVPGWAVPPAFIQGAPMPPPWVQMPRSPPMPGSAAVPGGSLIETLGQTVRLGIGLVNALLASSAGALAGMSHGAGPAEHGCGCGQDCCGTFSCDCGCRPGVNGCC